MLLACSDPQSDDFVWANGAGCQAGSPALSLSAARHDSLPAYPDSLPLSLDEVFYRAALHTPGGFAGAYLEPVNGRNTTVLMFVNLTNARAALDSLTPYYPWSHASLAPDSVRFRKVRWDWVQLYDWYRYLLIVAGVDGLSVTDIQEVNNRLEFGAATAEDRGRVLRRLSELGVPCWLAAVSVQGYAVLKDGHRPPTSGIVGP